VGGFLIFLPKRAGEEIKNAGILEMGDGRRAAKWPLDREEVRYGLHKWCEGAQATSNKVGAGGDMRWRRTRFSSLMVLRAMERFGVQTVSVSTFRSTRSPAKRLAKPIAMERSENPVREAEASGTYYFFVPVKRSSIASCFRSFGSRFENSRKGIKYPFFSAISKPWLEAGKAGRERTS
jgi:hypothetical protein